jgi:hypothetical protein
MPRNMGWRPAGPILCAEQVKELTAALEGREHGKVAALVREAAAPMREQEAEIKSLRQEVERHRRAADEVLRLPARHPLFRLRCRSQPPSNKHT